MTQSLERPEFQGQVTIRNPSRDEVLRILSAQASHTMRTISAETHDARGKISKLTTRVDQLRPKGERHSADLVTLVSSTVRKITVSNSS